MTQDSEDTKETHEEQKTNQPTVISPLDLATLRELKLQLALAKSQLELADSRYNRWIDKIYLHYGLPLNATLNEQTGEVSVPQETK